MNPFRTRYGPWALVTGASSGIGAQFAQQLALRGLNIVVTARRTERLSALAEALSRRHNASIRCLPVDLATPEGPCRIASETEDLAIGLVVHAAGVALTGPFLSQTPEDQDRMLALNSRAAVQLAHIFGRRMQLRGSGGIILVASIAGFGAMPGWSHYAATKAHCLLFGEGLAHELAPDSIDVQVLCPGATATEFQKRAGVRASFEMAPAEVVGASLNRLGRQKVVVPGWRNKVISAIGRWVPRSVNTRKGAFILKKIQTDPAKGTRS